ncbi:hypothetical protein KFE25_011180 [Diacronema lutheri]|uniref:Sodium/hydrogen exchanger n=2 Tax=Diacronema lutheri TaxID=2081491 RepID=A0A8J5XFN5_DIALT|nr:hypothetical protein KFE25_011180 [Diacronema lutheri]
MAPRLLVAWVAASLVGCGGTDVAQAGAAPSAAASERASTLAPALGAAGALAHAAAGPSALPSEHAGQAAVPIATVPAAAAAAAAPSPSPLHASSSSAILHADVEMEEAHADEAATHESEHLALEVSVLILLLGASLAVGAVIHSYHITWLPESGATILIGLAFGLIVNAIEPSEKSIERKLYFDPHFFNLFLLPPIIFESGYALDQFLFFRNLGAISTFAVLGTLISTGFTWAVVYNLGLVGAFAPMTGRASGCFACLISAVDPVATLATFSALKVDPHLANLIFGESVLNDAVSLILFRSVSHYGPLDEFSPHKDPFLIMLSFCISAIASPLYGVGVGMLGAALLKTLGLGRHGHMPSVEMAIFWGISYFSFVGAEVPHLSGIVASLFCGIAMRRYAAPNLSPTARDHVDRLLKVLATVADTLVFLLVGLAVVAYIDEFDFALTFCTVVVILVGRALNVFPLALLVNAQRATEKITHSEQVVMWWSGLRGAIALALAVQVPGEQQPRIVAVTIVIVVLTIFVGGGSTSALLARMQIQVNAPAYDPASATLTHGERETHRHVSAMDGYIRDLLTDVEVPEPNRKEPEDGEIFEPYAQLGAAGEAAEQSGGKRAKKGRAEDDAKGDVPFVRRIKERAIRAGLPIASISGF